MSQFILAALLAASPGPIRFPDQSAPPPQPAPVPASYRLAADEILAVEADAEYFVRVFPAGAVKVEVDSGPLTIKGRFYNGGGKVESRKYKAPFVYQLGEPTAIAVVLFIPKGVTDDGLIVQKVIEPTLAPRPPPPGPGPQPDPQPPGPVTPAKLYAIFVEETATAVAQRGAMFNDKDFAAWLAGKGHRWRVADQNVQDAAGNVPADIAEYVADAKGKALPQLYLVSIENGKRVRRYAGAAPLTTKELRALMEKYGG